MTTSNRFLLSYEFFVCTDPQVCIAHIFRGHSFFHPRHNSQWPPTLKDLYTRSYPLHLFSYRNSWERDSIFPFHCWVLNKGTTGTIFIPSLVWRGPWLGIEPRTSRTRSQLSTTRLSRRRRCLKLHQICLIKRYVLLLYQFEVKVGYLIQKYFPIYTTSWLPMFCICVT